MHGTGVKILVFMLDVHKKVEVSYIILCKGCKPIVQFFFNEHSALRFVSNNKLCLPFS